MNTNFRKMLEDHRGLAVSAIRVNLRTTTVVERRRLLGSLLRFLRSTFPDQALRDGAARTLVALYPEAESQIRRMLKDRKQRFWYEIHFTMFSALERDDFAEADQLDIEDILTQYIRGVERSSGFAAWKAADILGDEWRNERTVELLKGLVKSAIFPAGRMAALHGLAHALAATGGRSALIRNAMEDAARTDRSKIVREAASSYLRSGGCAA
ncbi:MAG TPA: hypothetical protein VGF88_06010 [Acidobacteriaceae bacterium]|jgi:hypothetical protein